MKISKYLWIEKGTKFNQLHKLRLKTQNKCKKHFYIICTSYQKQWLFDIIESPYLTKRYDQCYLVGVAKTKEAAIQHVGKLINEIYNLKSISYDRIKT